ncbi:hypothetical protein [Nostoc sp. NMS4]|uniref:hypothetical protein n=1 Tax=Nostoc sp. NMS4 TaxID=2815390 RepID=UPI0025E11CC2|nr:hypothetical protein [Nostoc sp. NMS4]
MENSPTVPQLYIDIAVDIILGIENTEEEDFYGEFQPWLQKKLGITMVSSWSKMIMLYCHDEKAGFEKCFNLLDEFKQRNQNLDANEVNNICEDDLDEIRTDV